MTADLPGPSDARPSEDLGDDGTDVFDLLGAYALDAVDDVERRAVERLVASDPTAAGELAGLIATAAVLGSAVATAPPPELRSAVLKEIRRTPRAPAPERAGAPADRSAPRAAPTDNAAPVGAHEGGHLSAPWPPTRSRRRTAAQRRTGWLAVAATALGTAAIPSVIAWQQAEQSHRVELQVQAFSDLLAQPGARIVRADVSGGGTAVAVLAGDRAFISATGLKDPGTGKVYQLWVLRDGTPLPDAVMPVDAGTVRALTNDFVAGDALAVTVEPAGGSQHPTTPPIVTLTPA